MTRIASLPMEQWDKELRDLARSDSTAGMSKGLTLRRRLREFVRLRIAFHNQCRSCMAAAYTERLVIRA